MRRRAGPAAYDAPVNARPLSPPLANPAAALPGTAQREVLRCTGSGQAQALDAIAEEVPVALAYNGAPFVVMMATPADLEDFALGFTLSEAIAARADEVHVDAVEHTLDGIAIALRIPEADWQALATRRRNLQGRSGCGVCGAESIEAVLRAPPVLAGEARFTHAAVHRAVQALQARQPLNAATGAVHAAGFADAGGRLLLVREDVGRHNALDKLIGALARGGIDPGGGFAVATSRASYEMAMKAAQAGIPLLAAISAPTTLAIALAGSARLCLVGFARTGGHVVYTHAQRLHGPLLENAP